MARWQAPWRNQEPPAFDAGECQKVEPIQWGKYVLSVECTVRDSQTYTMRVRCSVRTAPDALAMLAPETMQEATEQQWEGKWGEEHKLQLLN